MKWQEHMTKAYLVEVMRQRDFALLSAMRYVDARKKYQQQEFEYGDVVEMYAAVQGLLSAAAQISKLLWVSMPKDSPPDSPLSDEQYAARRTFSLARAKAVRRALKVTDDSILKNRQVRNGVEHFDERMDRYIFDGAGDFNDSAIYSMDDVSEPLRKNILRHIDPYKNKIYVFDKSINIKALWEAIAGIGEVAAERHDEML